MGEQSAPTFHEWCCEQRRAGVVFGGDNHAGDAYLAAMGIGHSAPADVPVRLFDGETGGPAAVEAAGERATDHTAGEVQAVLVEHQADLADRTSVDGELPEHVEPVPAARTDAPDEARSVVAHDATVPNGCST